MKCEFTRCKAPRLTRKAVYGDGIWVCGECYDLIDKHRCQPWCKVMDKVAMLEAGYHINRKLARTR